VNALPARAVPSPQQAAAEDDAALVEAFRWKLALDGALVFAALLADQTTEDKAVLVLNAAPGPVREAWMAALRDALQSRTIKTLPTGITADRLLGGLDLSTTLSRGERVMQSGLLAQVDRSVLTVPMAEVLDPWTAAQLCKVLDDGGVRVERDGESGFVPSRFGLVLCDESEGGEGRVDPALLERAALHIDLQGISIRALTGHQPEPVADGEPIETIEEQANGLCCAFGLFSLRAPLQLLAVTRAIAELGGREVPHGGDIERAMQLSLIGRAQKVPAREEEQEAEPEPPEPETQEQDDGSEASSEPNERPNAEDTPLETERPPDEMSVEALLASLPPGLLEQLRSQLNAQGAQLSAGRKGRDGADAKRGRPLAARRGTLSRGKRLDLLATLRASAPWQKLRRSQLPGGSATLHLRSSDFHVRRFKQKSGSSTLFAVDASGSTAVNRLAEAKGAVELLLGESYARRDTVGLIAFRGREADVLLEPTRSLVRAKRSLATLPGGGGTPLASGLEAARIMAQEEARKGRKPTLVLITDGSANVCLDGKGGRAKAMEEALAMASTLRADGVASLLIDVGRQPTPRAQSLAQAMGARYVPMPVANSDALKQAVSTSVSAARGDPRAAGNGRGTVG